MIPQVDEEGYEKALEESAPDIIEDNGYKLYDEYNNPDIENPEYDLADDFDPENNNTLFK